MAFTPFHRGGSGPPLVCLHGFADTWRTWELVMPRLERHHDVLALTLAGHAGGPTIAGAITDATLADEVERALDRVGFQAAHLVGNSLGGYVALQLASRDRARTVVALAPAGGWAPGDESFRDTLALQSAMLAGGQPAARLISADLEHVPAELLDHQLRGVAGCTGGPALIEHALRRGWRLQPERVTCPVRVVWGTADLLLPWPSAAARFRHHWLPHADWVELEGVGHCPQLARPLETAQLILGFTAG